MHLPEVAVLDSSQSMFKKIQEMFEIDLASQANSVFIEVSQLTINLKKTP